MTHPADPSTGAASQQPKGPTNQSAPFSFLGLLVALVFTLLMAPVMQDQTLGKILMHGCFTLIFLTGLLANRQRPWLFYAALGLTVVGIPLSWILIFSNNTHLDLARLVVDLLFFSLTAAMILTAVLKDHLASIRSLLGAISVYLLMGLSWACAYSALEIIESEPFRFVERQTVAGKSGGPDRTNWPQLVYYSFVTMSTLGFGDITPRTPMAQTLTWMQAVFGQLYLVVLIARLVSLLPHDTANRLDSS